MKKQVEQAVKEIMKQYDRIDINRRGCYGKRNVATYKNVKNKGHDDDNRCGRKTTH